MRQRHNIPAGKSLLLRLSVCRFFLFCCLAVFACSAFGQKVKQEAVFYKNAGILAVGNMSKGKFVEGSRIKFYRFSSAISYRVKKSGDEIYLKHGRDEKRLSDLKILIDCIYYKENEEDRFKGFLDCDGPFCYGTFKLYNSPDSKSFVHNSKDPSGKFFYDILSVDSTQAKIGSWLVSAKKTEAGYLMRAKNDYDRYIAKSKLPILVEGILPLEDFDIKSAIGIPLMTLMHKLKCAKVTLKSRDEFDGTVKLKRRIEGIVKVGAAGEEELDCELLNGTYKYHLTGDVFVGEYQRIYHDPSGIHIPTRGTMKFANGDSITGDWLAGYTFDYDDWEKIFDESNGPTDIRNKAIALKQQKDEEEAKKRAAAEENERQTEARRQYLISKSGNTYGEMLAKGKVCIGMTKEMVIEAWPEGYYVVSQVVFSGKKAEQWVFSEDKFALYCAQTGNKDNLMAYMLVKQLGLPTEFPKEMFFVDGVLKGLSQ